MCGADWNYAPPSPRLNGLPPRVRSRHGYGNRCDDRRGITSACAEQTFQLKLAMYGGGDYLRVCGADARSAVRCL